MPRSLLLAPCVLTLGLALTACPGPNLTHPPRQAYVPPQQQVLPCLPDLDGSIDVDQMQPAIGIAENFLISPAGVQRPIDVAGTVNTSGKSEWDWSTDLADDQLLHYSASTLSGKSYAAAFPTGQFTLPLDAAGTLDAVYSQDSSAIYLLGIASIAQGANPTLLPYQQPVAVFRFPLAPGSSWTSVGQVINGTVQGLPYAGMDTYEISVDAAGQLDLPDYTFQQVLRVRTHLTTVPGAGNPVSRRQVSFLFQCFGEVARATSLDNEPNVDFTVAAEVRRLGL